MTSNQLKSILILFLAAILLTAFSPATSYSKTNDTIVRINAMKSDRRGELGTGFFISSKGHIITCYHVIENSKRIEVYGSFGEKKIAKLVKYSNDNDIALLKVDGNNYDYLDVNYSENGYLDKSGTVIGHPNGIVNQHISTDFTSDSYISSLKFLSTQGKPLFQRNIDLLPLDITIYGGMSGAPVLVKKEVVGIISGSINQGGSLAWAIPIKYANNMSAISGGTKSTIGLPGLSLMSKRWRAPLRSVKITNNNIKLNRASTKLIELIQEDANSVSDDLKRRIKWLKSAEYELNKSSDYYKLQQHWLVFDTYSKNRDMSMIIDFFQYSTTNLTKLLKKVDKKENYIKKTHGKKYLTNTGYYDLIPSIEPLTDLHDTFNLVSVKWFQINKRTNDRRIQLYSNPYFSPNDISLLKKFYKSERDVLELGLEFSEELVEFSHVSVEADNFLKETIRY